MDILRLFKTAINSLRSNKGRTFLTSLGIIIGIFSVIVLMSIGEGAKKSIESTFNSLGTNTLTISSGAAAGANQQRTSLVNQGAGATQTLTNKDFEAVSKLKLTNSNIIGVMADSSRNSQIIFKGNNTNTSVTGTTVDYTTIRNYSIESGQFFTNEDNDRQQKFAILGATTKITLFGEEDAIGQSIKIGSNIFKVIGVFAAKGQSAFTNQDDLVVIPIATYQRTIDKTDKVRSIIVQVNDSSNIPSVQSELNTLLLTQHKIADTTSADFNIRNSQELLNTASSITGTFTLLLAAIASISLLVGGIGIMNTMIISVKDRTREIGLKKAIGAHESAILSQFLIESIVLTMLGGLFGILLGVGLSYVINSSGILSTSISAISIILSLSVSIFIGIVFGIYPAWKASRLSPIDALKYE